LAQTEARVPIAALGNILLLTLLCFKSHTRPNVVASKSEEYRARAHDAEACALEVDDPDLKVSIRSGPRVKCLPAFVLDD